VRLATIRTPAGPRAVRIDGDEAVEIGSPDVATFLDAGEDWPARAGRARGIRHPVGSVVFAPVVTNPRKVICLGLNYRSHIEEMGHPMPDHPTLFAKYPQSLCGAHDPIPLPPESQMVDWEVELAFVIGRRARRARGAGAADAIAGFTIVNDISMRDWQTRTMQFLQGKMWDRSTPAGPVLVTLDELDGGARADFVISCEIDGEMMQKARTADLLFPPVALVEYISTIVTLEPGDLVATGTPSGVGAGRTPPVFLKAGNVVRTAIEGIGELVNECVEESAQ
jgi:acylpyruvate hydrolase